MGQQDRKCTKIHTRQARQTKGKYHEEEERKEIEKIKESSEERTCNTWSLTTEFSI